MDEHTTKSMLERMVEDEPPNTAVSVQQAITTGRRRIFRRRLATAGIAAAVVCGVVGGATYVNTTLSGDQNTTTVAAASGFALAEAPASFDPKVRFADFGWLPGEFTERTVYHRTDWLEVHAGPQGSRGLDLADTLALEDLSGHGVTLRVQPRGAEFHGYLQEVHKPLPFEGRQNGGKEVERYPNFRYEFEDAPAVNGAAAQWVTLTGYERDGQFTPAEPDPDIVMLRWQYAPEAWASITVSRARLKPNYPAWAQGDLRELAHRVASSVRFGLTETLPLPIQLKQLPDLPLASVYYLDGQVHPDSPQSDSSMREDRRALRVSVTFKGGEGPKGKAQTLNVSASMWTYVNWDPRKPQFAPNTEVAGRPASYQGPDELNANEHLLIVEGPGDWTGSVAVATPEGAGSPKLEPSREALEKVYREISFAELDRNTWFANPLG